MGDRSCSWFLMLCLCCSFIPMVFLCSNMGPSHRIQSSMNSSSSNLSHGLQFFKTCFSRSPFPGVQSFGNGLFQCACSSHRPQVLPENLHLHGFLSTSHSSCYKLAPLWTLHKSQLPSTAPSWGLPQSVGWISAPPWSSVGYRKTVCFTMQGNLFKHLKDLLLSFFNGAYKDVSLIFYHSSLTVGAKHFLPFLRYIITETMNTTL